MENRVARIGLISLFIAAPLVACSSEMSDPMVVGTPAASIPSTGVLDVVIDTDLTNEIDDEFALVYALLSPERLNVLAIHAAPYSLSPELVERGALSELGVRLLKEDLEGLGVDLSITPVRKPGPSMEMAYEMAQQIATLMDFDPSEGIHRGSARFLPDMETPVESDAATNLIELASRDRESKLIVIANGAITNVASALLQDPSIADEIVVLWTAAYPSFWPHPNASFNLVQDLDAARVVFESGVQVIYIPGFFVGEKLRVTRPEMVEYIEGRGDVGDFLFELYEGHPLFGSHYAKSKVLWDLVTVGYLVDASWFAEQEVAPITIDEDRRWIPGIGARVLEPIDVERDRVFRDFYDKMAAQEE